VAKYDAISRSAIALITRAGGPVVLRRRAEGTYDPVSQQTLGQSVRTETLQAVVLPGPRGEDYKPGSLMRAASIRATFALRGASMVPMPGDFIEWDNVQWTIVRANVTNPAGDGPIIAECEAE